MLRTLTIQNYCDIGHLDLEFIDGRGSAVKAWLETLADIPEWPNEWCNVEFKGGTP